MQQIKINNQQIEITVHYHGAELRSIKNLITGNEYLWNADPKYWGRTSPILFPFVGSLKDKVYRHESTVYPMNPHGFARDMDFELLSERENEVWLSLKSTKETYKAYPFHFQLEIGYRLVENTVVIMWRVRNLNEYTMYFSIGAHPAFLCPFHKGDRQSEYYLGFAKQDGSVPYVFLSTDLGQNGNVVSTKTEYVLENGLLPITEDRFDIDTLIIADSQVQRVALLDKNKQEYVAVEFQAPLVGIWSPPRKNAPFVCIEPWYGRCDNEAFTGELKEREWGNVLEAHQEFYAEYKIII